MNVDTSTIKARVATPAVLTVLGSTALLTAGFVGVAGLASGVHDGALGRVPYYVLVFAIVFLGALWRLDSRERDGLTVLVAAAGIALGGALLVGLAVEGVIYAVENPGRVLERQLIVYFTAAAVICTALGIWGLRHWREFATAAPNPTE